MNLRHGIRILLLGILPVLIFEDCIDVNEYAEYPDRFRAPVTSALLTGILAGLPGEETTVSGIAGNLTSNEVEPCLYIQYLSESQHPHASLYGTSHFTWDPYYKDALEDLAVILRYNTSPGLKDQVAEYGDSNNQLAIARILKVFFFWHVTDRWGDVPYFGALEGQAKPRYDAQKLIYYDFFSELKEAAEQFDTAAAPFQGDVLFHGDFKKWQMFSTSLRMIMALRISGADPDRAREEFIEAQRSRFGYVDSNSDNVYFKFIDGNFENPWNTLFDQQDDYGISHVMINTLRELGDPRLTAYARPTVNGEFIGLPYGLSSDSLIRFISWSHYSRPSLKMLNETFPGYVITAAQMRFALSEAALRGWIDADAAEHYNLGIKCSFEQWGVYNADVYNSYLLHEKVQMNDVTFEEKLEKIGIQRWLALFPNGFEAWSEWRRTGLPILIPTPFAKNNSKQIPIRYTYPASEEHLNSENYLKAVSELSDGNSHDSKVWWAR